MAPKHTTKSCSWWCSARLLLAWQRQNGWETQQAAAEASVYSSTPSPLAPQPSCVWQEGGKQQSGEKTVVVVVGTADCRAHFTSACVVCNNNTLGVEGWVEEEEYCKPHVEDAKAPQPTARWPPQSVNTDASTRARMHTHVVMKCRDKTSCCQQSTGINVAHWPGCWDVWVKTATSNTT